MSLAKKAQTFDFNFSNDSDDNDSDDVVFVDDSDDFDLDDSNDAFDKVIPVESLDAEITVSEEDVDGDGDMDLVLKLDKIPGAENQDDLDEVIIENESEKVEESHDPLDWKSLSNFLPWISERLKAIPKHSGRDTVGLERAISYLETLDRSISKAVKSDIKDELDIAKIQSVRDEILNGIDRLQERLDKLSNKKKKKKASSDSDSLVKEAQKITGVKGIVITVPLLISRIARVCINGMVSGGHDIEKIFDDQAKKYSLNLRERSELLQLLEDSGYAVRRDRGYTLDEDIDITDGKYDWASNYSA